MYTVHTNGLPYLRGCFLVSSATLQFSCILWNLSRVSSKDYPIENTFLQVSCTMLYDVERQFGKISACKTPAKLLVRPFPRPTRSAGVLSISTCNIWHPCLWSTSQKLQLHRYTLGMQTSWKSCRTDSQSVGISALRRCMPSSLVISETPIGQHLTITYITTVHRRLENPCKSNWFLVMCNYIWKAQ